MIPAAVIPAGVIPAAAAAAPPATGGSGFGGPVSLPDVGLALVLVAVALAV